MRSFRENRPVDAEGRPTPWVNYALIYLLNDRLRPTHTVFEYGAGFSTLYFAERCAEVTAVEHDREWFQEVERMAPSNVTLLHRNPGPSYWQAVNATGASYDLVLIDGLEREKCVPLALDALSDRGAIVLDDSHREAYEEAVAACARRGFRKLRLKSYKPNSLTESECLVIYRSGNCLGI